MRFVVFKIVSDNAASLQDVFLETSERTEIRKFFRAEEAVRTRKHEDDEHELDNADDKYGDDVIAQMMVIR